MRDERATWDLDALRSLTRELRDQPDRSSIFDGIVRGARRLLDCQAVWTGLRDGGRAALTVAACAADTAMAAELPLHPESTFGRAYRERRSVLGPGGDDAVRLAVPLIEEQRVIGVLAAVDDRPARRFGADELRVLETVAWLGEAALARAGGTIERLRRTARTEALQTVINELSLSDDLEDIAAQSLALATSLFSADHGAVWLGDTPSVTHCLVSRGLPRAFIQAVEDSLRREEPGFSPFGGSGPIVIGDPRDPRHGPLHQIMELAGIQSVLLVPFGFRGQVRGALTLYHDIQWTYTDEDLSLLGSLGQQLGIAVAHAQLVAEQRRQLARVGLLAELGRSAIESLDLTTRCQRAVRALVTSGDLDGAAVYLLEPDGRTLRCEASCLPGPPLPSHLSLGEDSLGTRAVSRARLVTSDEPDTPERSRTAMSRAGLAHLWALPMVHQGGAMGALLVGRDARRPFLPGDEEVLRACANQIASAVEHARVFGGLAQAQSQLATILADASSAILIIGPDERVISFNPRVARLHGLEEGRDLTGWTTDELAQALAPLLRSPDEAAFLVAPSEVESERPARLVYEVARPQPRQLERVSTGVVGERGQRLGRVLIFREISPPPGPAEREAC
jgi:GAF domain-containing protein